MEKFIQIADEGAMIVMGRYEQQPHEQSAYQTEAALEEIFIQKLVSQGYERLHINNEADLIFLKDVYFSRKMYHSRNFSLPLPYKIYL